MLNTERLIKHAIQVCTELCVYEYVENIIILSKKISGKIGNYYLCK